MSHVGSGQKHNKPARCDIIFMHIGLIVCLCVSPCVPAEHCHRAWLMIARVDERQREKKNGGGGSALSFCLADDIPFRGKTEHLKINQ